MAENIGIFHQPLQGLSPTALAGTAGAPGAGRGQVSETKAAKDFESVLLHKLLEEMKRTIPDSGLLSSGTTRQVQDLFWFHLAEELAEGGGLGLHKQLQQSLGSGRPDPAPRAVESIS